MKILLVVLLLLPLLHAQSDSCPALPNCQNSATGTECIQRMSRVVAVSGQQSDYRGYLVLKFAMFHNSPCHDCIYVFCGLVQQAYGIRLAQIVCSKRSKNADYKMYG